MRKSQQIQVFISFISLICVTIFKAITPSVNDIAASHFVTFKFPGNFLDGR